MAIEPSLTVYSRDGCHLCDDMIAGLRVLQGRFRFDVVVVDVDTDPALRRRFGERVPVLAHDDTELCHYRLALERVTAYLSDFR